MFFYIFWLYTVPDSSPYTFFPLYVLPPIYSSPYTFFSLYVLPPIHSSPYQRRRIFSISCNTPKEYHAPFLKGMDPQRKTLLRHLGDYSPTRHVSMFSLFLAIENQLRHSGDYSPTRHISMFFLYFWLYTVPDSSPYTFFPLYILPPIKKANISICFNTAKEYHAPILKGIDPQRKPF